MTCVNHVPTRRVHLGDVLRLARSTSFGGGYDVLRGTSVRVDGMIERPDHVGACRFCGDDDAPGVVSRDLVVDGSPIAVCPCYFEWPPGTTMPVWQVIL